MQIYEVEYDVNQLVCREGDSSTDLLYLLKGKLLVCTIQGKQVKVISRIGPGEFLGELSFFDGKFRASHVVALEKSKLILVQRQELNQLLPVWYQAVGQAMTKKIRLMDHIIQSSNIRKTSIEEQKPLSIEEQGQLYAIITQQDA